MDTMNKTRLQTFLDNLGEGLSYSIRSNTLYLLHGDFICEINLRTDKMTAYTLDHQRMNDPDIELLYEIRRNVGLISSLAYDLIIKK